MIDMHYDLLSVIYIDMLNENLKKTKEWIKNYNKDNVTGLIANLYFMSKKEMKEELHSYYYNENTSVLEMFRKSTEKLKEILPKDIKVVFAIEGCDYIKDEQELEELRKLGLSSICIVWNEKNKYGSGTRFSGGLTEKGKSFICKAMNLGIGIDLSHTNEETFYDILDLAKTEIKNNSTPIIYVSHSNSRTLCEEKRNLKDEQLEAIKSVDGYVGVMSNKRFISNNFENMTNEELRKLYLKHIDYIGNIIGFNHVFLSTDDMSFAKEVNEVYGLRAIYDYKNIKEKIKNELLEKYKPQMVDDILEKNAERILKKIQYKFS